MLVAYRKSTGQVIPDFQSSAKAETLISNAVRHGIAEEDIEVRDLTEAEARAAADAHFAAARLAAEAEAEARRLAAIAVAKKLGLTRAEVLALRDLLNE